MRVAGIDYSSTAIDIVLLDYVTGDASHRRFTLNDVPGPGFQRALHASRILRHTRIWDDVQLIAIEEPGGPHMNIAFLLGVVCGQVLASVPGDVNVVPFKPSQWRPIFGVPISGANRKERVRQRARQLGFRPGPEATDDAYEAFGLAWVMHYENERGVRHAHELGLL